MAVTLAVQEFGLDSEVFSFGVKVHSARCLHATVRDVAKFSRCSKRITVFNSLVAPAFPGTNARPAAFYRGSQRLPFRNRNGTSYPCQWHHREQNNSNCRERRRRRRLSY